MKKISLLCTLIFAILFVNAQDFPSNGDFEEWTSSTKPEGWTLEIEGTFENTIPITYPLGARTSDAHSGSYAVKLTPSQIPMSEMTIPGVCQLGSSESVNLSLEDIETLVNFTNSDFTNFDMNMITTLSEFSHIMAHGVPVDEIPSEVRAWIKFHPYAGSTDKATFMAVAFSTLFSVKIPTAYGIYTTEETINEYQQIQFPLQQLAPGASCDSIILLMMVSGTESSLQSELYIDDVTMLFDTWGIDESDNLVQIYPNPADNVLTICNEVSGDFSIRLYDMTGKVLLEEKNISEKITINTSNFAPGNYIVQISQNNTLTHQKVIIY